jgi:NAD(P)-dependent dehydrogenase (short-subunit alcohol dehydrogenase family)
LTPEAVDHNLTPLADRPFGLTFRKSVFAMSLQYEHTEDARYALVTGASRGIGAEVAERLATEGYQLTVSARHEATLADSAERLARLHSVHVHSEAVNLAVQKDVHRLVQSHRYQYGELDVLVLAAGMGNMSRTADLSTWDADIRFTVGVRSAFLLVGACLPMLRRAAGRNPGRGARVIAVAPGPESGRAHKDALVSLCEKLNHDEADNGVTATTISPGELDNEMTMWQEGHVTTEEMVISADVADVVVALTQLSGNLVAPNIVLARQNSRVLPG